MNEVPLGSVAEILMGTAPPGETYNTVGEGLPMIAGAGDYGERYPETKQWTTAPARIAEAGDLIICVRATIGDLNWADKRYCLGRGVGALRPHSGKLDVSYLAHYMTMAKAKLERFGTGSTFPAIRRCHLEDFPIPLPVLAEQKRIAAVLDKADALRTKRRQAIAIVDALAESAYQQAVSGPDVTYQRLDAVGEVITGFAFPSESFCSANGGIRLCRGANVLPRTLDWNDTAWWPKTQTDELNRFCLAARDVILALDRPWISSGLKIAIVKTNDLPSLLVQRVARIRAADSRMNVIIYNAIQHADFMQHCRITETTIPHISPKDVQSFVVPVPSEKAMSRFTQIAASLDRMRCRMLAQAADLESCFASIQSAAFAGTLFPASASAARSQPRLATGATR